MNTQDEAGDHSGRMSRRDFVSGAAGALGTLLLAPSLLAAGQTLTKSKRQSRMNFLLITADDMNYNSPGFMGCRIPDLTPNLDRLAAESLRFEQAHVTVAV